MANGVAGSSDYTSSQRDIIGCDKWTARGHGSDVSRSSSSAEAQSSSSPPRSKPTSLSSVRESSYGGGSYNGCSSYSGGSTDTSGPTNTNEPTNTNGLTNTTRPTHTSESIKLFTSPYTTGSLEPTISEGAATSSKNVISSYVTTSSNTSESS